MVTQVFRALQDKYPNFELAILLGNLTECSYSAL